MTAFVANLKKKKLVALYKWNGLTYGKFFNNMRSMKSDASDKRFLTRNLKYDFEKMKLMKET